MGYFTGNGKDALALKDPYFNQVELLLKTKGVNGTDNGTFKDTSLGGHAITKSSAPIQGTFSPFSSSGWSMYVDGTSTTQGIVGPTVSSILGTGTGDWTVEFWYHFDGVNTSGGTATWMPLIGNIYWYNGADGSFWLGVDSNQNVNVSIQHSPGTFGTNASLISTTTLSVGSWYHIAVVKQSNTGRLYINGTQEATDSLSNLSSSGFHATSNTLTVGRHYNNGGTAPSTTTYGKGYFSNVRLTSSAVYPDGTTFTPSTKPLTAIANCKLLTLQDNRYVDNSSLNSTITAYDSAAIKPTSPFRPSVTRNNTSALNRDGSAYFDGTDDYLEIDQLGLGFNKTNLGSSTATQGFVLGGQSAYVGGELRLSPNNITNTGGMIKWQTPVKLNQDFSVYFKLTGSNPSNGTNLIAQGCSLNFSSSNAAYTGTHTMSDPNRVYGVILEAWTYDRIRIFDATTELAVTNNIRSNFLEGDTYVWVDYNVSSTTLSVYQSTSSTKPSSPTTTYNQVVFGSNDHYIAIGAGNGGSTGNWDLKEWSFSTNDFDIESSDFTIELWYYRGDTNRHSLVSKRPSSGNSGYELRVDSSTNYPVFYFTAGSGFPTINYSMPSNQWSHIAVVRSGSNAYFFVNGDLKSSSTSWSNGVSNTQDLWIGHAAPNTTDYLNGYVSNLRVLKGTALYTSNFTPPTGPLRNVPDSKLLLNSINAPIYDATGKNNLLTLDTTQINTTIRKFSRPSVKFDGSSDGITIPSDKRFDLGQPWTVEGWFYVNAGTSYDCFFALQSTGGATNSPWYFVFGISTNDTYATTRFKHANGSGAVFLPDIITSNVWQHFACSYDGSNVRAYIDGNVWRTTSISISNWQGSTSSSLYIGYDPTGSNGGDLGPFNGYMSDFRFTAGVARYTGNSFTLPTEEYVSA